MENDLGRSLHQKYIVIVSQVTIFAKEIGTMTSDEKRVITRAVSVTIKIESFTRGQELEMEELPFSVDHAKTLCLLCAREGIICDLTKEELEQVTVVECEVREKLSDLPKE
jgi:hypothetical protein